MITPYRVRSYVFYYKQLAFSNAGICYNLLKKTFIRIFFLKFDLWITCVKCNWYKNNSAALAYTLVSY